VKAKYFEVLGEGSVKCTLCPHSCVIAHGRYGACNTRWNMHGVLYTDSYGRLTSLALDPIEKKPLRRFYPQSMIWSVGSYGCNMRCGFCQNHAISQFDAERCRWNTKWDHITPEGLLRFVEEEEESGIGIAFTYNEPCLSFEYILDTAPLFHERGKAVVMVTNGQIQAEPLADLLPIVDAWNVDLKAFTTDFYCRHGGELETAKATIAAIASTAHLEVTTLVIPQENDSEEEIARLSAWLASLSPDIPLHLTRYFPHYRYTKPPTDPEGLYRLARVARGSLKNVYVGNV